MHRVIFVPNASNATTINEKSTSEVIQMDEEYKDDY